MTVCLVCLCQLHVCVRGGECARACMGDFVCARVRGCACVHGCVHTCLIACMHVSVYVPVSLCVRACACATTIKRKRRGFLLLYPYFTYSVFISGVSNELNSYVHYLGYACICLSIPSICANTTIIIIYTMMQKTQQKKLLNMMLRQQAIADLLISIMLFFNPLVNIDKLFQPAPSHTKFPLNAIKGFTIFLTLGILLISSTERLLAVRWPLFHRRVVTGKKLRCMIIFVWFLSSIPALATTINYIVYRSQTFRRVCSFFRSVIVITAVIAIIVILILTYNAVKISISRKIKETKAKLQTSQVNRNRELQRLISEQKKEMKLFKIFLSMAIFYLVTYIPILIFITIFTKLKGVIVCILIGDRISLLCYCSSALFNPFVTICMKDDFKNTLKKCTWYKYIDRTRTEPVIRINNQIINETVNNQTATSSV